MSREHVITVRFADEELAAARAVALEAALQPGAWVRMLLALDSLGATRGGCPLRAVPRAAQAGSTPRGAELPVRLSGAELRGARARAGALGVDLSAYVRALARRAVGRPRPKA